VPRTLPASFYQLDPCRCLIAARRRVSHAVAPMHRSAGRRGRLDLPSTVLCGCPAKAECVEVRVSNASPLLSSTSERLQTIRRAGVWTWVRYAESRASQDITLLIQAWPDRGNLRPFVTRCRFISHGEAITCRSMCCSGGTPRGAHCDHTLLQVFCISTSDDSMCYVCPPKLATKCAPLTSPAAALVDACH
jgi:hypothetical protein